MHYTPLEKAAAYAYALGFDDAVNKGVVYRGHRVGGAWQRFEFNAAVPVRLASLADGRIVTQVGAQLFEGLPGVAVPGLSSFKLGGAYANGLVGSTSAAAAWVRCRRHQVRCERTRPRS